MAAEIRGSTAAGAPKPQPSAPTGFVPGIQTWVELEKVVQFAGNLEVLAVLRKQGMADEALHALKACVTAVQASAAELLQVPEEGSTASNAMASIDHRPAGTVAPAAQATLEANACKAAYVESQMSKFEEHKKQSQQAHTLLQSLLHEPADGEAIVLWIVMIFMCSPTAGCPSLLTGIRIGEASHPGPWELQSHGIYKHQFDIAEPDWSDRESDGEESIHTPDDYLQEISADSHMGIGGSPHEANESCADSALPSTEQVEAWLEAEKALGIKERGSTPTIA